jgi:NAD(P)H-hydrate epimerase
VARPATGAQAVGQLSIAPIGIPDDLKELQAVQWTVVDSETVRKLLPERPADSNKGTFGKVLVVAGSVNYIGAAGLAAEAAYRSGAGLVTVGAPQPVVAALAGRFTEATWLLLPHDMGVISQQAARIVIEEAPDYQAMILGPGWGREETTRDFLTALLDQSDDAPRVRARRKIGFLSSEPGAEESDRSRTPSGLPLLVIDADGESLAEMDNWWKARSERVGLTPHPGEMARLTKTETKAVQANRWEIARDKAVSGVILLLKGAHTLIAAPDGRVAVLPFKTDALATAGTGDVLAGTIAGLLAQGLAAFEAAIAGGYLHGLAGQTAAEWGASRSVIAGDVLSALEDAIEMIETI